MKQGLYNGKIIDIDINEKKVLFSVLLEPNYELGLYQEKSIQKVVLNTCVTQYLTPSMYFTMPFLNVPVIVRKNAVENLENNTIEYEIIQIRSIGLKKNRQIKGYADKKQLVNSEDNVLKEKQCLTETQDMKDRGYNNVGLKDILPGDVLLNNGESGVGVLTGGLSYLKASLLSQIICLEDKDLVRIVSKQFEHLKGSGPLTHTIGNEGDVTEVEKFAFNFENALQEVYNLIVTKGKTGDGYGIDLLLNQVVEGDPPTEDPTTRVNIDEEGVTHCITKKAVVFKVVEDLEKADNPLLELRMATDNQKGVKAGFVLNSQLPLSINGKQVTIASAENDIDINSNAEVNLQAKKVNFTSTEANFEINSNSKINLIGDNVHIEAKQNVELLAGGKVDIQAVGTVSVRGSSINFSRG